METQTTDFMDDVKKAILPEVRKKNYAIVLRHFSVKKFDAIELDPGKDNNDFNCELEDGKKLKIEFKNYENVHPHNICLEQKSWGDEYNGWTFKLDSDYIIFIWQGKKKECYLILKGNELREWWKIHHKEYRERFNRPSTHEGKTWQSSFSWVPIKDFPKDMIHTHKQFIDLNDFW